MDVRGTDEECWNETGTRHEQFDIDLEAES